MAWTGLNLTAEGRIVLNKAQLNNKLNFKSIVVGDGNAPTNFSTQKELVNQLYELENLKINVSENECTLTADLPVVDYDYYLREIGIIVTTDNGDKLYAYDNCGDDAQYIVNTTGVERTEKRIRLALVISGVDNITVSTPSILYVDYKDYEETVAELRQTKVNVVGGDISNTIIDFKQADTIENIKTGEKASLILGKISKAIDELMSHLTDKVKHITSDERTLWNTVKNKVDSIPGKGLSANDYTTLEKSKLSGIAEKANNYLHPASHPANMIEQDATHRFVSDNEKTSWNDANSKKHTHSNKSVLDGITSALIASWNKITDKLDKTGDASNTTTSFSIASTRTNIATGEKLSISLGKIAKWFSELKTVAFTGNYIDLSNKPTIPTVGNGTITITQNGTNKGSFTTNQNGNTTIALSDNNTTYSTGNVSTLGLTKLYAETGTAIDGTMTQKAIKSALDNKLSISGGTVNGDIVPDKDETYDLGHEDKKWDNIWAHTLEVDYVNAQDGIRGNLTGNADTATKAMKDSVGDNIITSYRKRRGAIPNNDFNNATVEGVYTYGSSTGIANSYTNGGIGGIWGTLEVFNNGYNSTQGVAGTVIHQIAFTTNNQIYFRQRINASNWTPWKELTARFSNFVKSGTGAKAGLVPAPSTTAGTTKYLREDGTWQVPPNTNTTYGAGTGIGLSDTTFYNTGVRGVATGSKNGTMAVNTNGTVVDVPVKGLGALAYASGTWNKISGTNCTISYHEVAVYLEISAQGVNLTEYGGTATNKNIVVLPTNVIPTKGAFLGAISALNSAWVPLNKTVVCDLTYNSRNLILRPTEALSNVTLNLTAMFPRSLFTIN